MAPKLFMNSLSPACRAVLMCAQEVGINLELNVIDLTKGEHLKPEFLKKNPQHTIPVLEDDDVVIVDSHAIMGYLVGKYAMDDSIYPKDDIDARAIIDHKLHFDSSILYVRGLLIASALIHKDSQPSKENLEYLKDAFAILDKLLQGKDYIAGGSLSIADFSILSSVTAWETFVPTKDFPNIVKYVQRMQKLPFSKVNLKGVEELKSLLSGKLKA
ncbi:glutathione S-transferase 1-like [Cylas formicarius]|uniref:glutathione S-transferase 1-like n=1 Tax=Cylas formicarius TaxID=197179 RepID=UPI002958710D|nr:glutathione S-transferase 1-like [Cylas formicarius]